MTRWLAPLVVCAAGCGASSSTPQVAPDEPGFVPAACAATPPEDCVNDEAHVCRGDSGYDRIRAVAAIDEGSSGVLSVPEPGTICLTGHLPALGPAYEGKNMLVFIVDDRTNNGTCVRAPLDARALGIRTFEFELDHLPLPHMSMSGGMVQQTECDAPPDCAASYTLLTHDRQDLVLLQPGTNRAALADFVSDLGDTPFDTRRVSWFGPSVFPIEEPVDYSFCVSGLRFLDAAGRQVKLP